MTTTTPEMKPPTREPTETGALVRNAFWHGKLMGVAEFEREQTYVRTLQQTLTRTTVGCGVLCGLGITGQGVTGLTVDAGAAVDGIGQLILVPYPRSIDNVSAWMCPGPGEVPEPGRYELCIAYHECPIAPTPALVTDCETRLRCEPGAVEERYRFELRSAEQHRCGPLCPPNDKGCLEHGRCCPDDCGPCVTLAWFDWDGQQIRGLTMDGRIEVPSNRELHDLIAPAHSNHRCHSGGIEAPRLLDMWPHPGSVLDRMGSPSEWAQWRYRPRLELTFDQPIDIDGIDDPNDWLRAWVVPGRASGGDDAGTNGRAARRLRLRYLDRTGYGPRAEHSLVYAVDQTAIDDRGDGREPITIIVQAIADSDTGPRNARPVARPAQLEYGGTGLDRDQLDALWAGNTIPSSNGSVEINAAPLPECFGDGYDGGRLHTSFTIAPVAAEPTVTALHPANGARTSGPRLPAIEVSSAAELPDFGLKAWLVDGDTVISLPLDNPIALDQTQRAAAMDRFEGSVDSTLFDELATTIRFAVGELDELPRSGRVLAIAPAQVGGLAAAAQHIGGFTGTCYSETDIARIYNGGLDRVTAGRLRPSLLRMPRSSAGGMWIHWTFAWEQDDDIIR